MFPISSLSLLAARPNATALGSSTASHERGQNPRKKIANTLLVHIRYIQQVTTPGQLLREARERHGVSQKRLAIRAGTTQSAISRIERDRVSPSVETLRELLYLLGEDLDLRAEQRDSGVDRTLNAGNLALTPEERIRKGLSFADFVRRHRGGVAAKGTA
jgi:transcriptional regulator with XRE-family HTH domain